MTIPTGDHGIFAARRGTARFRGAPCLFLDRDGVVIEDTRYLHRPADIRFIPGAVEAIARVNRSGLPVVIVTNQAGIGRGFYGWEDFHAVQHHIERHCQGRGASFDMVLACGYHREGIGSYAVAHHPWRKPNPGMLLEAARVLEIDLARSFIVGDRFTDLAAGRAACLRAGALVRTGYGERQWSERGEAQFAEWRREGRFSPRRVETAAVAIDAWLAELDLSREQSCP